MATKWTYRLEKISFWIVFIAAIIGMFFIGLKAILVIGEHSEPARQTLQQLLRSGQ